MQAGSVCSGARAGASPNNASTRGDDEEEQPSGREEASVAASGTQLFSAPPAFAITCRGAENHFSWENCLNPATFQELEAQPSCSGSQGAPQLIPITRCTKTFYSCLTCPQEVIKKMLLGFFFKSEMNFCVLLSAASQLAELPWRPAS